MDGNLGKRTAAMAAGIAIIGLSVGFYRLSGFGVDAFTDVYKRQLQSNFT